MVGTGVGGPLELCQMAKQLIDGSNYKSVKVGAPWFLEDTELAVLKINYVFVGAGIGDHVCYMPAMIWIAKNCPWVEGRIFVSEILVDVLANLMRDFPLWKVMPAERMNDLIEPNTIVRGPGMTINGRSTVQLLNGTGTHLVWMGFAHFVNQLPPPEDSDFYPQLDFTTGPLVRADSPNAIVTLRDKKYVVFTTGGGAEARTVPGHYWNPIIDHVIKKGLIPVFLGTRDIAGCVKINFPEGCNYDQGIDLRDRTTLFEAAWIMKNAKCMLGLDNGLIHIAALTDASIIAGYNTVHPKERRARRHVGKWAEIALTQEELSCANCQTNQKVMSLHSYKYCLYKGKPGADRKCIDILFENNGERWTRAIDTMLE